jgi:hypothetical protein
MGYWLKMDNGQRTKIFANPFFSVMLATSVAFVVTVLAYLISPSVLAPAQGNGGPGAGSIELAVWFDRNGPFVLGVEILVMLVTGTLAMLTDPWFTARSKTKPPG